MKKNTKIRLITALVFIVVLSVYFAIANSNKFSFGKTYNGSYSRAYEEMLPAAENGDTKAQVNIGMLYEKGLGVKQSYKDAYNWYKKAADKGDAGAFVNLALMYEHGFYVEKNIDKAVELYKKAISIDNNFLATYSLAQLYLKNTKKTQNISKGLELLNKASESGNIYAMGALGLAYYTGNYGLSIDYGKAFELTKKASENGNPVAQNNLGIFYFQGKAVDRNDAEAYKWLYIASKYGKYPKAEGAINALSFDLDNAQIEQAKTIGEQWVKSNKEINFALAGIKK